ncbi:subunit C of V-type proton ATPase, partial [Hamiltosporidium magnivora]
MYLFIGLPYDFDEECNSESLLREIRHLTKSETEIISLPRFRFSSLEFMMKHVEDLDKLEIQTTETFFIILKNVKNKLQPEKKEFGEIYINDSTIDFYIKKFKWSSDRYDDESLLKEILESLHDSYKTLKNSYLQKTQNYEKIVKEYEKMNRETKGNLKEMNISGLINYEEPETQFIKKFYVVVNKSDEKEFLSLLRNIEFIHFDSISVIVSDNDYILFSFVGIKSKENEIKKKIQEKGYFLKNHDLKKGEYEKRQEINNKISKDYEITSNNYKISLNSLFVEIFILMIHIKYLKVYMECVLRYGIPCNYVYFVCWNKFDDYLFNKWKKVIKNWRFSKRISISSSFEESDNELECAFSKIECKF